MMRTLFLAPLGLALLAAACGETTGERATTGAAGGAVTGAAVGGPVGAVVGGGVGAAGGAYRPEIDQKTNTVAQDATNATGATSTTTSGSTAQNRRARGAAASSGGASQTQIRQAQTELQKMGYYHGKIDGLYGRQTAAAVRSYQAKENLSQTGKLDRTTMQHLRSGVASGSSSGAPPSGTSGSTAPSSSPNAGSSPANSGPNAPGAAPASSGTSAGESPVDR
jgi:peptidoglycan hydrolase-like protein with peptidoglycan-binding domain